MNKDNKKHCNVVLSYQWSKDDAGLKTNAYKAFKEMEKYVNNGLSDNSHLVNYRRLRGTAGSFIVQNIYCMIRNADIIIVDITKKNLNVLFELGIAFSIQMEVNKELKIYLIREDKKPKWKIPSNLAGYFYSEYSVKKNSISFADTNSLRMSIIGHLQSKLQLLGHDKIQINDLIE